MRSEDGPRQRFEIVLTGVERPLPEQLTKLLTGLPAEQAEIPFTLPQLALALGCRLPEQAQTITFWQRGDLGRTLRRAGFAVQVEYGRVLFVRRTYPPGPLPEREGGDGETAIR